MCIVIIRCMLARVEGHGWTCPMFVLGTTPKHVHLFPTAFLQFHLQERLGWMCKLGMISQERLKIEVKLLLSANSNYRKSYMQRRLV